jgi:hypothetical protein
MRTSLLITILCFSVSIFACSSKVADDPTPPSNTTSDPGEEGSEPSTGTEGSPAETPKGDADKDAADGGAPKEPTNQTECIAACEVTYPTAAADNHQLDQQCFFGDSCGTVCNNLGQGATQYPDQVSSLSCNTVAAGSYPIGTPSQACSNCLATTPVCCDLWVKIFGSPEGKSLSQCAHTCWDTFQQ